MRRVKPKYFRRKSAVKYSHLNSSLSSIDHEIRRSKIILGSIVAGLVIFFSILANQSATFFSLHVTFPTVPFDQLLHSIPSLPTFSVPKVSFAWLHMPTIRFLPSLPVLPSIKAPSVNAPAMPHVAAPHIYLPKISFSISDVFLTICAFFASICNAMLQGILGVLHFLDPRPVLFAIVRWLVTKIMDGIIAGNTVIQPLMPLFALLRSSFFQTLLTLSDGVHSLGTILIFLLNSRQ